MVLDNNSKKPQSASQRWRPSSNLYSRLLSNKTVTTSWQGLTKLPSLEDRTQQTQPTSEQSHENHTIPDVLLCRGRARYYPHFTDMQEPSGIERRDMAITNNTPWEALWTRGFPKEDHQICSGNWTPHVKANKKKKKGGLLNSYFEGYMIDWLFNANISNISAISWYLRFTVCKKKLNGMHNNIKLVLLWAQLTKKYPPPFPHLSNLFP